MLIYVFIKHLLKKATEEQNAWSTKEYVKCIVDQRLQIENKNLLIDRLHGKLEEQLTDPFWTEYRTYRNQSRANVDTHHLTGADTSTTDL
jgi:radical SAM superfamily enzyme